MSGFINFIVNNRACTATLIVGLLVSVGMFQFLRYQEEKEIELTLSSLGNERSVALQAEANRVMQILRDMAQFFSASEYVNKQEFNSYVSSAIKEVPAIHTILWLPRITDNQRERAEKKDYANIKILDQVKGGTSKAATKRKDYYPIYYAYTGHEDEYRDGVDLYKKPHYRNMIKSLHKDKAEIVVKLEKHDGEHFEFSMMAPVYGPKQQTGNNLIPKQETFGYLYLEVNAQAFVELAYRNFIATAGGLDLYVFWTSVNEKPKRIYFHASRARVDGADPQTYQQLTSGIHKLSYFMLGDKKWAVIVKPIPGYFEPSQAFGPWLGLIAGLVLTFVIASYFKSAKQRHQLTEDEVAKRTSELSKNTEKLQSVLNTVIDGIITISSKGIVQDFNPAAEKIFGYAKYEVVGRNVSILMPEPYHSEHDRYLHNYLNTGNKKIIGIGREVMGRRKDGSIFPMDLAVSETPLESERVFTGIVRDITERKLAEQALEDKSREIELTSSYERTNTQILENFSSSHDKEEILRQTLEVIAKEHDIPVSAIYLYDEWFGMLGRTASYGVPKDLPEQFNPGEGLVGQVAVTQRTECIDAGNEAPLYVDAGVFAIEPKSVVASPIVYRQQALGVIVLATVNRKLSEYDIEFITRISHQIGVGLNNIKQYDDLKALSEQLKERSNEVAQKNTQLEQANRLKTEFLANMSHELRTPLNAIIGFSEVLKDNLLGELNEGQDDYVKEIFDSANHLLSLINDILDLSKIEAGKLELFLEPVNIPELLKNSFSVVKEKAHSNRIALKLNIDDDISTIKVDGRKFKQIIYNLLSNAVKFTPEGGEVKLDAQRRGDKLHISVIDTGIGIAEDKINLLFRPFEQVDGTLSRKFEGTGLGLAMVKRLVELHGGHIHVESKEGKGSCFSIEIPYRKPATADNIDKTITDMIGNRLPVRETDVDMLIQPENDPEHSSTTPKILIIEDNDQAAELLNSHLEAAGFQTCRAQTGADGLAAADSEQPDLIVLDILLPDISGWEVMKHLTVDEKLKAIPVIVVSIVADSRKGLELGAIDVFEKPVHKEVLLEAINKALPIKSKIDSFKPKVMVVDDDKNAVEFVSRQLTEEGYNVLKAYGGKQAIALALAEMPDLLILDLMMPEVTGFDVVASLRNDEKTADIPVIVLSSKVLSEEDREMLNSRVVSVVNKQEFNTRAFMLEVMRTLAHSAGFNLQKDNYSKIENGLRKVNILVVEDNPGQSDLMRLYLEDAGYSVTQAFNGTEALDLLNKMQVKPALITLDLLMPEMDGFTFLETKARNSEIAEIPVMVISSVTDQTQLSALSANAIMNKPLKRSELLQSIERIVTPIDGKRVKVLLIDDDPKAIKIISSYLPSASYEVFSAFDGRDGLALARAEKPELIFLDLMMPDVNGFDVLSTLKQDAEMRSIPIIILTAKILSQEERRRLEDQIASFAEKGQVSRDLIVGEIEKILGGISIQ